MTFRRGSVAAAAMVVLAVLVGTGDGAIADGGTQRWTTSYLDGEPAFTSDVVTSPDGSTVA